MARYAYDVNTTQRLIDVHKQFQGGLKTVDTDDALGAVFLREAENVSLSEFGFLEKRYGTYQNFLIENGIDSNSKLQGYWEFKPNDKLYIIYAVDGKLYSNQTQIQEVFLKEGLRYPTPSEIYPIAQPVFSCAFVETGEEGYFDQEGVDDLDIVDSCANNKVGWFCEPTEYDPVTNYPTLFHCVEKVGEITVSSYNYKAEFQSEREVSGFIKNNALYLFNGTYPFILVEEDSVLKTYLLPIEVPTYDEIVVLGHNLLEDDYENVYGFETPNDYDTGSPFYSSTSPAKPEITKIDYYPRLPFQTDGENKGELNFSIDYSFPTAYKQTGQYRRLSLESVKYRSSGPGAGSLDFIPVDLTNVDFEDIDNDVSNNARLTLDEGFLVDKINLTNSQLKRTIVDPSGAIYFHLYEMSVSLDFSKDLITPGKEMALEIFKATQDANDPWEKLLLSSLNSGPEEISVPKIIITPKDENGNSYENSAITIESDNITLENDRYVFYVPLTLSTSDFVSFYEVTFEQNFQDRTVVANDDFNYGYSDFVVSVAKVNILPAVRNFQDNPLLDFSITDLISGNFDFEVTFSIKRYSEEDGFLTVVEEDLVSGILYNIPITPEKLQDYPGAENVPVKLKSVWSCNKVIEHFGKLMVWGSKEMPSSVFYSFPDRPAFFPSKFYLDFTSDDNSPVQAVTPYMNILVVQTEEQTWGVRGNSGLIDAPSPYIPFMINPTVGTIAPKSVRPVRNHLFFLSKQGVIALKSLYAADEQYNIDFMDRNIRNIVPQDKDAVGIQFDNQYWLNFPKSGITLRWYIDKKAWVLDRYNTWKEFKGILKYQISNGKLEFITLPSSLDGQNTFVYKIGIDESLPSDLGNVIISKFETSFLNQNYPFHLKNYKEFKYDFTMQNEYNASREAIYSQNKNFTNQDSFGVDLEIENVLKSNHYYRVSFQSVVPVSHIKIGEDSVIPTPMDSSFYYDGYTDFEFIVPNSYDNVQSFEVHFTSSINYNGLVSITDITYDSDVTFLTKIITEERNVLNRELNVGYDDELKEVIVDLSDFENFTLGTSYFGDRVTFVKTIKLSGKGYNTKAYFEDFSKSKWTIESMGITYKMKKARSR